MANPFIRAKTKDDTAKYPNGYPFTINMTLTEVRNANALLKFTSDSFGQANDDITSVILNELGFPNVEDDSASQASGGDASGGDASGGVPPMPVTEDTQNN